MDNDSTFVAPEGVYSVTDEHKPLSILSSLGGPSIYPTKVVSVVVSFPAAKQGAAAGLVQRLGGNKDAKKDRSNVPKDREDGVSLSSSDTPDEGDVPSPTPEHASTSQEPHSLFSPTIMPGKRKQSARPKNSIRTTSSTFIARIQTAEGLSKALQSKQGDVTFLFYNISKNWVWAEAGSKSKDPLTRITFSSHPTCHAVNTTTASPEHLDVIIGFNSGDLIWLDGSIVVYDKERDDGAFIPQDPIGKFPDHPISQEQSIQKEWDPTDSIFVTIPPWHPVTSGGGITSNGKAEKEKAIKNPVSHWRVSHRSIVGNSFSPAYKESWLNPDK
ncbi:hypothetical protein C0992_001836 [Termitomyces sp. T32_za158]|nr:hypothetical protein C0992_001836 [Termitomyces sp. T32_za158]